MLIVIKTNCIPTRMSVKSVHRVTPIKNRNMEIHFFLNRDRDGTREGGPLAWNVDHLLAATELTREQSAIFRIKGEKIQIF